MKKVVYSLAVLFSVAALASCGGNKAAEAADSDTVAVEVVEETATNVANDTETGVAEAAEAVEAPAAESAK